MFTCVFEGGFWFHPDKMMQNSVIVLQHGGFGIQHVQNIVKILNSVPTILVQWVSRIPGPVKESVPDDHGIEVGCPLSRLPYFVRA